MPSLVVASTCGKNETDCVVNGTRVIMVVNASIPKKEGEGVVMG